MKFSIVAAILLMGVAHALPSPAENAVQERCHDYHGCGFCGFYERCCYKPENSNHDTEGYCTCGISGKESHCW
ncbi:hypothetical protein BCR34DRAFT_573718 [Clohesyomyces aquaticus]|uniref:Uncharacterized protein n=1 Tax=Clohesyomyces aquaticus TaxID=1231657 RepID=A0A1Y1YYN3_9PLEO|nr:hypothetical protein BCR34DRAFT_573718 [Clohesyomyces aquaticus]